MPHVRLPQTARYGTMPPMTDDAHAQANAEQVRVLREALTGTGGVATQGPVEPAGPAPISAEAPSAPPAS